MPDNPIEVLKEMMCCIDDALMQPCTHHDSLSSGIRGSTQTAQVMGSSGFKSWKQDGRTGFKTTDLKHFGERLSLEMIFSDYEPLNSAVKGIFESISSKC